LKTGSEGTEIEEMGKSAANGNEGKPKTGSEDAESDENEELAANGKEVCEEKGASAPNGKEGAPKTGAEVAESEETSANEGEMEEDSMPNGEEEEPKTGTELVGLRAERGGELRRPNAVATTGVTALGKTRAGTEERVQWTRTLEPSTKKGHGR
jgi:hypothetical protein